MRVLVTRPGASGAGTAARLKALGHVPLLWPVTEIAATRAVIPPGPFGAVVATSAHAFNTSVPLPATLRQCPLFTVGAQTANTARNAGFADVRTGNGTAHELAAQMISALPPRQEILFLAGKPRKSALEDALGAAGHRVTVVITYIAQTIDHAAAAPLPSRIDATLHYSRASAERFVSLLGADDRAALAACRHVCLSQDVAQGLVALGVHTAIVATEPNEVSLFSMLDISV